MKKLFLALVILVGCSAVVYAASRLVTSPAVVYAANQLFGSTEATYPADQAKSVSLDRFKGERITRLRIGHSFEATVTQEAQPGGISLTMDSRLEPYLVCRLSNGELTLNFENLPKELMNANKWSGKPTARISAQELATVKGSGAAVIKTTGEFATSDGCEIDLSGAAQLQSLTLTLSGKADLEASGAAHITNLQLKGEPTKVSADLSGAASISVSCRTAYMEIQASGAAQMKASGSATRVEAECSGAAVCNLEEIQATSANCSTSGAARIICNVSETLNATASGGSNVSYKGNPAKVNAHKSGAGSVSRR